MGVDSLALVPVGHARANLSTSGSPEQGMVRRGAGIILLILNAGTIELSREHCETARSKNAGSC